MNQTARKPSQDWRTERYRREEAELREARQNERVERRHVRLTRRAYACFVLVTVSIFGLLFAVARLNISSAQKALRARELQMQAEEERKTQESLRMEVARLESAARIEKVAERELGMIRAGKALVIRLKSVEEAGAHESVSLREKGSPEGKAVEASEKLPRQRGV